ncbi:MAG: DNA double-strand break repair nuclease NurA [Dehalococcoidia bacterium]
MTLDLVQLAGRIDGLVSTFEQELRAREARIARARSLLDEIENEALAAAVGRAQHANWLMVLPVEPIGMHRAVQPLDAGYATLATDGSSIDIDRHGPATCYLINIGHACLHYGAAEADLGNEPELTFASDRLLLADRTNASKESVMTGNLLDAYRTAREMLRLAQLALERRTIRPLVALLDGQFVLWGVKEAELSSSAQAAIFEDGILVALDRLRDLALAGNFALGSYISRPAGREVINSLRVGVCPRKPYADCLDCPRRADLSRPCDDVAAGSDQHLLASLLSEGERKAIFRRVSPSADFIHTEKRYEAGGHGMRFFYLKVAGGEIGRVELPEWVAEDGAAVDLLHATVLDQCARGDGYPVVLQEAHEQAVIDIVDRRSFAALIERELERRGQFPQFSAKSISKRRRTI